MKIEIDSVNFNIGNNKILQNIYLIAKTNEIVGFLGRNGSGKSSLFKIIFGFLKAENSSIRINGIYTQNLYKSGIMKFLPQTNLFPLTMKIKDAIKLINSDFNECNNSIINRKININTKFEELSGGERRIIEIIIIINTSSKFIILDEPFIHLMPIQIEELKKLLILKKKEKCFLISDHQYKHILQISDSLYLLKDGTLHLIPLDNSIEFLQYYNYIL